MKLSVVIPAYNEEKDIEKAVRDVESHFPGCEIIVVNDASTDKTLEILQGLNLSNLKILTNEKNMGHGESVVRGLSESMGDFVLYMDADRQIGIEHLSELSGKQFDVASGWRVHRQDKLFRKVISFCLKTTNLLFHRYYIKDANCPFKIYKRSVLMHLLTELPKTYIVPIACLEVMARKHGYRTITIKTPHKPYDGIREGFLQVPGLKVWKFCFQALSEVIHL